MSKSPRTRSIAARTDRSAADRKRSIEQQLQEAIGWLKRHGARAKRDRMARYAIPSGNAFGVSMSDIQALARRLGRSHDLAATLWNSGWYEARTLAAYVDEPAAVTPAQMDRWCRDFDNRAICDTVCFALFDRTPHAWRKVEQWSRGREEFVKRAAFALLWGLTVHDKSATNGPFLRSLIVVERAATDDRHFVKKAVNMALRAIGKRNRALNAAALDLAKRLAASPEPAARWVGSDAARELTSPSVTRRLAKHRAANLER